MNFIRITYFSTVISVFAFTASVFAGDGKAAATSVKSNVSMPVTELQWASSGIIAPNGIGPLQVAPAFGDLSKGAHSTFVKMPAGFVSGVHTHTHDYYGVVITGVAANTAVGDKDIPLPPGSYWFQSGDKAHVTKCISTTECIFFVSQGNKFDYLLVH